MDRFVFLNEKGELSGPDSWNDPAREKLWLYNLHYFDDLNAVDAAERLDWHRGLIQRWIEENPAVAGNGWESYSLSLRIVNWVKWVLQGTNVVIGNDKHRILAAANDALEGRSVGGRVPDKWDGKAETNIAR